MGCYADAAAAREAIAAVLPSIDALLRQPQVSGLGVLAIVVMDPARTPADGGFEAAVLAEHTVGPRERWDVDYLALARAKARLAWRCGADSGALQALSPQRLAAGDSLLAGGVCFDGIVVAVSGCQPWVDEALACCVAAHLRAVARRRRAQAVGLEARAPDDAGVPTPSPSASPEAP